jgi:hypothetical protein
VHAALEKAARESGTTPEGWIASRLIDWATEAPGNGMSSPSDEQIAQANTGLDEFVVHEDLGYNRGGDNQSIDTDLARSYQEHNGLPLQSKSEIRSTKSETNSKHQI